MGPKPVTPESDDLFVSRLDELINMRHALLRLASLIDWSEIERSFGAQFNSGRGRPALPPRLVAGLLYLQHTFGASDQAVVNTWIENPYWQYFCGEVYLQTEAPIDPSSLTCWRKRIGEEGVETLLMATIDAARRSGVVKASSVERVIVDTSVMPKAQQGREPDPAYRVGPEELIVRRQTSRGPKGCGNHEPAAHRQAQWA